MNLRETALGCQTVPVEVRQPLATGLRVDRCGTTRPLSGRGL